MAGQGISIGEPSRALGPSRSKPSRSPAPFTASFVVAGDAALVDFADLGDCDPTQSGCLHRIPPDESRRRNFGWKEGPVERVADGNGSRRSLGGKNGLLLMARSG